MPNPNVLALSLLLLAPAAARAQVLTGIDVLETTGFAALKGKRVGLITNQTGKDRKGRSTLSVFTKAPEVALKAFFSPEHGASGNLEGENIASGLFRLSDGRMIPLYSLYGGTRAPTSDMLKDLDVLVFDIQDIGSRFYTYDTTMALAMEASSRAGVAFMVLDRPNPIGGETMEGPILEDSIRHFTAYFPIPVRHGLTVGEIAGLHNKLAHVGADLQVVKLSGWTRSQWYDQTGLPWTKPSPNMPNLEAATLYPGIGCFEATNISVGRGTRLPFRWVGAPWMNAQAVLNRMNAAKLEGVKFSIKKFRPGKSVFQGEKCRGLRIKIADRRRLRPLRVFAHLLCAMRDLHPKEFSIRFDGMERMTGTKRFRELYESGAGPEKFIELFDAGPEQFKDKRAPFLLY